MGKSGGSAKQRVVDYRMSVHVGICHGPVDFIREVYVAEKPIGVFGNDTASAVDVTKADLFGGPTKEGGVAGRVQWLPGQPDQVLPTNLAEKLGKTPATAIAYRGIASVWFSEFLSAAEKGFYWVSNQPYLRDIWCTVQRIPRDWYPFAAAIPIGDPISIQTVDVDAITNAATTKTGGLSVGIEVTTDSTDVLIITQPPGGTYVAWSGNVVYDNRVDIIPDGVAANSYPIQGENGPYGTGPAGAEFARSDFGTHLIGGSTSYRFYILDSPIHDNSGGVSLRVERYPGMLANPAHIIVDCLTNKVWGMGGDISSINDTSFREAADIFFNERLGLALQWREQTKIELFVQEILTHAEAVLYINPSTGLFELKAIRGDYDEGTLPVLDKTNARVISDQQKQWGETINEMVVTWTNPTTEKEETVTLQDPGNIAIQGGIVSDARNYYGVRTAGTAMTLCERELRAASMPLASTEIEVDRTGTKYTPGSVVKVNFPDKKIFNRIMRVGPCDYGGPKAASIRLSLMEDVFATPAAEFEVPIESEWEDPSEDPAAIEEVEIITLPYYLTVQLVDPVVAQSAEYPEVFAGVLAGQSGEDTRRYRLYAEVPDALGNLAWTNLGTRQIISRAMLGVALALEAQSTLDVDDIVGMTQGSGPTISGLVFIGTGGDEGMEIAIISSFTDPDYTIERGVLDTVPRAWPVGTPIWFMPIGQAIHDNTIRSDAEVVTYKLLSVTSNGVLAEGSAPEESATLTGRPHLPSRPADVEANGEGFPAGYVDSRATDPVVITWARRNRETEDSQILLWGAADVTPEVGQTTNIRVYDVDGNLITSHTGETGVTFDLPHTSFGSFATGIVRVESQRDGLVSLQAREILVMVDSGYGFGYGLNYGGDT